LSSSKLSIKFELFSKFPPSSQAEKETDHSKDDHIYAKASNNVRGLTSSANQPILYSAKANPDDNKADKNDNKESGCYLHQNTSLNY
jgi:hypothetical protein